MKTKLNQELNQAVTMPWEEPLPYPNTVSGNGGTDAVVAGRHRPSGFNEGYELGFMVGSRDAEERLAKAYASGAGLDIEKIRQEEYRRGYKEGSKVSEEARKAFYQQGYDEGEQASKEGK